MAGSGVRPRGQAIRAGHFTWKEWAAALADELEAAARGEPDDGSRYYQHWLATLERLVTAKGLADPSRCGPEKKLGPKPIATRLTDARRAAAAAGHCRSALASARARHHRRGVPGSFDRRIGPGDGQVVVPQVGWLASSGLGSLLGMRHALEPDHLAAVSTLVTGERSSYKAAWLGACWGVRPHRPVIVVWHGAGAVSGMQMPARVSDAFEFGVALMLIGLGLRAILYLASPRQGPAGPVQRPSSRIAHPTCIRGRQRTSTSAPGRSRAGRS